MEPRDLSILERFKELDSGFLSHVIRVLNRLPAEIREKVLTDESFQMVSRALDAIGQFWNFDKPITSLAWYNPELLKEDEVQITHTIAQEIAHWIIGKGESGLHEKEAEDLLTSWGFKHEVETLNYKNSAAKLSGFEKGYEWAKDNEDKLPGYEEYLEVWDRDGWSMANLGMLLYQIDPFSILSGSGEQPNLKDITTKEQEDITSADRVVKSVVAGVMHRVRERKEEEAAAQKGMNKFRQTMINRLERIKIEISCLYDEISFCGREYLLKSHQLGIDNFYINISTWLEELKKEPDA